MAGKNENLEFVLSQYLDGQLTDKDARDLERRIKADGKLAEELRRYSRLEAHLKAAGNADLPGMDYDAQKADIIAALERKVLLEAPRAGVIRRVILRPTFGFGALAAAAAIVIVAGVALLMWNKGPTTTQTPVAGNGGGVSVKVEGPGNGNGAAKPAVSVAAGPQALPGVEEMDDHPNGTILLSIGPDPDEQADEGELFYDEAVD